MFRTLAVLTISLVSLATAADEPAKPASETAPTVNNAAPTNDATPSADTAQPGATTPTKPSNDNPTDVPITDLPDTNDSPDINDAADKTTQDPTTGTAAKYPVDSDEWLNADPLLIIDTEMNSVVVDLKDGELFRPHTNTQPRIIARFDKLIEILERKKSGVGSASPNSSMPAEVSGIRKGGAEAGELTAKDDQTGAMDKLPPNQRKKIQQATADGFPPGFEDVLSDYFRRLAETKTVE